MEAEVLKGAVKTKRGYGDAAARPPPLSVTRLKLSDEEKRDNGGRITCSIQLTLIPSPIVLHTPHNEDITHRTGLRSHTKAISLSPSSSTGAFRL